MEIFNINDYKKVNDIDLDELDDRYVNTDGDSMDALYVKNIFLFDPTSAIAFADNTIQTTAFQPSMITEYNDTQIKTDIDNLQKKTNTLSYNNLNNTTTISSHLNVIGNITQNGTNLLSLINTNSQKISGITYTSTSTSVANNLSVNGSLSSKNAIVANSSVMFKDGSNTSIINQSASDLKITGRDDGSVKIITSQGYPKITKELIVTVNDINFNDRPLIGCSNLDDINNRLNNLELEPKPIKYYNEMTIQSDFTENKEDIKEGADKLYGTHRWKNYTNNGDNNNLVKSVESVLNHPGILRLFIAKLFTNYYRSVNLGLLHLPCCMGDLTESTIIFKTNEALYSNNRFRIIAGVSDSKSLTNSIVIRSNSTMEFEVYINGSLYSTTVFPNTYNPEKWLALTVIKTNAGATIILKNLTDDLTHTRYYIGTALNNNALISPWISIETTGIVSEDMYIDVDYIDIKYKTNRG